MKHAGPLEVEVKLRIPSTGALRPLLTQAGFTPVHPEAAEANRLWDRDGELMAQDCALRLRQYGDQATLTWKGPKVADPQLKIRPEVETGVADPEAMEGILRALGFTPVHLDPGRPGSLPGRHPLRQFPGAGRFPGGHRRGHGRTGAGGRPDRAAQLCRPLRRAVTGLFQKRCLPDAFRHQDVTVAADLGYQEVPHGSDPDPSVPGQR
jgi:hypothetical protein